MRFVKLGIISIVILFIVITLLSLLLPSQVRISRAIDINGKKERISAYLSDLNTWAEWNTFISDSSMVFTDSSSVLQMHALRIKLISSSLDSVRTEWLPAKAKKFQGNFDLIQTENITTVQWYFDFHLEWYPWQKFQSIIFDKQMGPSMEASLLRFRDIIQSGQ